jgi:hypothetical protein
LALFQKVIQVNLVGSFNTCVLPGCSRHGGQ